MSLCVDRGRQKYCPQGDGTFRFPYPTTLVQAGIRVDVNPLDYISIVTPTSLDNNNATAIIPPQGSPPVDVEGDIEAVVAWWRPATALQRFYWLNSTGLITETPPDDRVNQWLYDLRDVSFSLTARRTGTQYNATGFHDHDGMGGWHFVVQSDTSAVLTDVQTIAWDPKARAFSVLTGATCFKIDPAFDNGAVVTLPPPTRLFLQGARKDFTYSGAGTLGHYTLALTLWNAPTFTWDYAYYTYDKIHYSCCAGCSCGTIPTIPSGSVQTICVASSYVDCGHLPVDRSITGPAADHCVVASAAGCTATIDVSCLTQAQVDSGTYKGLNTVTIRGTRKCYQGGVYLCEVLTGQFYVGVGKICSDAAQSSGGVDVVYWKEGYHIADAGHGGKDGLHVIRRWHHEMDFDHTSAVDVSDAVSEPRISHPEHGPPLSVVYIRNGGIHRRESYDYGDTWISDPPSGAALKTGDNGLAHCVEVWNERTGQRILLYNDQSQLDAASKPTGKGKIMAEIYGPDLNQDGTMKRVAEGPFQVTPDGTLADATSFGAIFIPSAGCVDCVVQTDNARGIFRSHDDGKTWSKT